MIKNKIPKHSDDMKPSTAVENEQLDVDLKHKIKALI